MKKWRVLDLFFVTDEETTFTADTFEDATWLCDVLNKQETPAADAADDETNGA
jgi:hypothetical protein